MYLDGGARPWHGEPSTIVDFASSPKGVVLRKGALSVAEIREICPSVIDPDEPQPEPEPRPTRPRADETPAARPRARRDPRPTRTPTDEASELPVDSPSTKVWSKDAGYHEPTTDELRITHSIEDPDQPSLFEGRDEIVAEQDPPPTSEN